MKKAKHNKKRNTAVLYEVLVMELTKSVVDEDTKRKKVVLGMIKEHFKKGTLLAQELDLYKVLSESSNMSDDTARRLLDKAIQHYNGLDSDAIFAEQTALLKKMNRELPKTVFTNFIPDYKSLATISQIFSKSTPIKDKVLLESRVLETLTAAPERKEEGKLEILDNLTYKTFVNKFNTVYGESLLPEQKELMTRFVMSFSDNGVELKSFLNEEVGRLRQKVEESLKVKEVAEDSTMVNKTELVLERMGSYREKPIDKELVGEVLKIQALVKEIEA